MVTKQAVQMKVRTNGVVHLGSVESVTVAVPGLPAQAFHQHISRLEVLPDEAERPKRVPGLPLYVAGQLHWLSPEETEEDSVDSLGVFDGYVIVRARLSRAEARAFAAQLNGAHS